MAIFTDEARPGFHPCLDHKSAMVVTRSLDAGGGMWTNLAFVPLSQDPKESPLTSDRISLKSPTEGTIRKCPNTGESGGTGKPATTQSYGGARPRSHNPFSFSSPGGVGGGQGNGDDEDDRHTTDYKKKRLNCDRKQRMRTVDRTKWGKFKDFHMDRGGPTDYPLDKKKSNMGKDECDASMAEQADLLQRQQTNHECPRDQVIYSNLHGNIVAFVQRLYRLWRDGSFITPGLSEGVIFNRNLTLNDRNQYRFGEEFTPFAELGRGDFGITRACMDWRSDMKIATKEIPRERFLPFEVLLLTKLRSPFIVQFLGATAERSALYLHMELVDNALQLEYLAGEGAFLLAGQDRIADMIFQLLAALDCLSRCNVLHRDLTCRNVLLTTADRIKVIDFNLAVPAPYEQKTMPVGDIHYLAPEVTDGSTTLNCSSDLWSCGIIIISLLRGLPQNDDCERMALTEYHPLHCRHLSHCHPALLDLLQLILTLDPYSRPPPADLVNHRVFTEGLREELEDYPARNDSDSPDVGVVDDDEDDDITNMFRQLYLREGALHASPPEDSVGQDTTVPLQDPSARQQDPSARQQQRVVDVSDGTMEMVGPNTMGNPFRVKHAEESTVGVSCDLQGPTVQVKESVAAASGDLRGPRSPSGAGACKKYDNLGEQGPTSPGRNQRSMLPDEDDCRTASNLPSHRGRKERRTKSHRIQLAAAFSGVPPTPTVQQKELDCGNVEVSDGRENVAGATTGVSASGESLAGGLKTSSRGTTKGASCGKDKQFVHQRKLDSGASRAPGGQRVNKEASFNMWGDPQTNQSNAAEMRETTEPLFRGAVGGVLDKLYYQEAAPQNSIERDFERMEIWEQLDVNACVPPPSEHYGARGPNTEPIEGGREELVMERFGPVEESMVQSHVVNPYSAQQNLCDGPYQYPEEWLHGGNEPQQSTVEEVDQGEDESNGHLKSHESSYRGANQDEEALASEILIDQLSMETDPDVQDRVYQHIASGGSKEPSLT